VAAEMSKIQSSRGGMNKETLGEPSSLGCRNKSKIRSELYITVKTDFQNFQSDLQD
jgi:hypothetical protein